MDDRLYRSRADRVISGVAGGVADRLDMDPSIVRVVWAVLIPATGGLALLAYVVMAFVVPDEPLDSVAPTGAPDPAADAATATPGDAAPSGAADAGTASAAGAVPLDRRAQRRAARLARRAGRRADGNGGLIFGAILIAVGGIFFVRQYLPDLDFDVFWPSALVVLGVILVAASFRRNVSG